MGLGTFYICATPIGNLQDVTLRLLDTLKEVDLIAAENTQTTRKLLTHFNIKKKCIHIDQHNEEKSITSLLKLLQSSQNIAYVSEAGTPNIADPGKRLVQGIRKYDIPIVPIPGPSAVTTLLSASSSQGNTFHFAGFVPKKRNEKLTFFNDLRPLPCPVICYETANRLASTLEELANYPVNHLVLGKELTKKFEHILEGTPNQITTKLTKIPIKGEWALIIEFKPSENLQLDKFLEQAKQANLTRNQAILLGKNLFNFTKNMIYSAYHSDDMPS